VPQYKNLQTHLKPQKKKRRHLRTDRSRAVGTRQLSADSKKKESLKSPDAEKRANALKHFFKPLKTQNSLKVNFSVFSEFSG
jgi:hypothetical protein